MRTPSRRTDALAWYFAGNAAYAQKSIALMDAWSATIRSHTSSNGPPQTGWAGSVWPRAADIIRHAYGNWPDQARFAAMLRTVYLPVVINGSAANGNWELSMMEAAVGISVLLDDKAWGLGSYAFFNVNPSVVNARAFEVPVKSGVRLRNMVTVSLGGVGTISRVINNTGAAVNSSHQVTSIVSGP